MEDDRTGQAPAAFGNDGQGSGVVSRRVLLGGLGGLGALAAAAAIPPQARAPSDLSFLVLGDWGRGGNPIQRKVAAQMASTARAAGSQFVVTVGDNFYETGVRSTSDPHWRRSFLEVYDLTVLPRWIPALGNHDHDGDPNAQLAFSKLEPRWDMPARYYRQTLGLPSGRTLDMFVLDTSPLADPENYPQPVAERQAQWDWFDREAGRSQADWKLVFGHHPIASSGKQGRKYPYLRDWLRPRLKPFGIQAYVAGHDHHLEHVDLDGVPQIISGGGSKTDGMARIRAMGHVQGWPSPGFTEFRIRGDDLTIAFIDPEGTTLGTSRLHAASPETSGRQAA